MDLALPLASLLARLPVPLDGRLFHRAGLAALAAGRLERAERLFELAAARYRRELRVEALARLRVHACIARARRHGGEEVALEVERRLQRLATIEALAPPFALVDARRLVAAWDAEERRAAA